MLPGITPALFGGKDFLAPAQAFGNDSYTVSLLHMDSPDNLTGVAGMQGFKDYAYGAPLSRRDAWQLAAGSPQTVVSYPFNQVATFPGGTAISLPDAPDLDLKGDFTVDFWFCYGVTTNVGDIIGKRNNSTAQAPFLFLQNASSLTFYASSNGSSWDIANGVTAAGPGIAAGTWYHFACVKQGNTYKFYINGGLQAATVTSALVPWKTTMPMQIGGVGGAFYNGYLDEVRVSKIARWTAAFTPPNQPYYARLDVGGNDVATKLLLHFDLNNFLGDSALGSMTKKTIVNSGGGQLGSPNNPALTLNVAQYSGTLRTAASAPCSEITPYRGNFTVDFMYYRPASVAGGYIVAKRATNAQFAPFVIMDNGTGGVSLLMSTSGAGWEVNATIATGLALNTWYHLALVRDGANMRFFVNGTQTWTQNIGGGPLFNNAAVEMSVGAQTGGGTSSNFYIDELRYSDVARYTGPFTAPIAGGLPYGPNPAPPQPATHFSVSAPATASTGVAFNITVTALDASNTPTLNYSGTVHFTSTNGSAVLPANSTLSGGVGTFAVTLNASGTHTITATDTVTGSINGTTGNVAVTSVPKSLALTSSQTWTVPADWNSANNYVYCIGGGGGGGTGGNGGGGGGGGYARKNNIALTPSTGVGVTVGGGGGAGSAGNGGGAGGNTSFAGVAVATGGGGGTSGGGGGGGMAAGDQGFAGGAGGAGNGTTGGGGGGSGGTGGAAGRGGAGDGSQGAGGGGGCGGGTAGQPGTGSGSGGAGGNSPWQSGGAGGTFSPGGAGGNGSGGGGGGGGQGSGGAGGNAPDYSGGGGGGCSASSNLGGNGGFYGAGGGGSNYQGGSGAQGVVYIWWLPA
jgi:hypothetical protein